jgi:concanavalin A-like lectin/glucanase superfamily protein
VSRIILPKRLRGGPILRRPQRGFLINPYSFAASGGGTDPYFSNVIALLHMNGANNGTSFPDSSPLALTTTVTGNAKTSTAQSIFNGSSGLFDGSGDWLNTPTNGSLLIGSIDFTIECWSRPSSVAAGYKCLVNFDYGQDVGLFLIGNRYGVFLGTDQCLSATVTTNVWRHIAWTRASGVNRLFVNGVKSSTDITDAFDTTATRYYYGASAFGVEEYAGYLAELRITKGVARYTANFTPPTSPFPDS